ncbi:DNA-binding protein HU [Paraconexibacter sp. AEG42_29]|uniref:DNA-binding protein HU n=1 Tax=Paraconexibacter sp. AEG42_29 TaxID=2997339 RepID=A0AAU7AYB0_9ACTN
MTKSEFVDQIAGRTGLERRQAADALEAALTILEESLASGGEVTLTGFGKFHVAERGARPGVNPRTGERIEIAATRIPRFTAGSSLKKAVRS